MFSIRKASKVQHKRIIRTICNSQRFDHTSLLFHRENILKFEDIYTFLLCVHMFKSKVTGKFRVGHDRNTRQNNSTFCSFHRLTTCQKAFFSVVLKFGKNCLLIWEQLNGCHYLKINWMNNSLSCNDKFLSCKVYTPIVYYIVVYSEVIICLYMYVYFGLSKTNFGLRFQSTDF